MDGQSLTPGLRLACRHWHDASNLTRLYDDLLTAYDNGSDSVVDLSKAIVETVCITLLEEFGAPRPPEPNLGSLLSAAFDALGLGSRRGSTHFRKLVSQHNRLAAVLNDLRNAEGTVSHGKDGFIVPLSTYHRRMALLTADSLVSFLFEVFQGLEPDLRLTREPYKRFNHLHREIDDNLRIEAESDMDTGVLRFRLGGGSSSPAGFEIEVLPSELLFHLDRQAYVEILRELRGQLASDAKEVETVDDAELVDVEEDELVDVEEDKVSAPPVHPEPEKISAEPVPSTRTGRVDLKPLVQRQTTYTGAYVSQVQTLYDFIFHRVGLEDHLSAQNVRDLAYTVLNGFQELVTIDWNKHASTKSRMRIFVRRALRSFGLVTEMVPDATDAIVEWLANHLEANGS